VTRQNRKLRFCDNHKLALVIASTVYELKFSGTSRAQWAIDHIIFRADFISENGFYEDFEGDDYDDFGEGRKQCVSYLFVVNTCTLWIRLGCSIG